MHVVQQAIPWWWSSLRVINSSGCAQVSFQEWWRAVWLEAVPKPWAALAVVEPYLWLFGYFDYCDDSVRGCVQLICVTAFNPGAWLTGSRGGKAISSVVATFSPEYSILSLNSLPSGGQTIVPDTLSCDPLSVPFRLYYKLKQARARRGTWKSLQKRYFLLPTVYSIIWNTSLGTLFRLRLLAGVPLGLLNLAFAPFHQNMGKRHYTG